MEHERDSNLPALREGDVAPYQFDGRNIRIVMKDDEYWFIATDAATELAYRDAHDLCRHLDDDEKGTHRVRTLGGGQDLSVISEAGLYRAILQRRATKKVDQKFRDRIGRFQRWVYHDVLPKEMVEEIRARRKAGKLPYGEDGVPPRRSPLSRARHALSVGGTCRIRSRSFGKEIAMTNWMNKRPLPTPMTGRQIATTSWLARQRPGLKVERAASPR